MSFFFFAFSGTSSDEMCNLYIMYYMEARHAVSFMTCTQNVAPDVFRTIPPEASIPIPVQSDMVMMHGHHKGKTGINLQYNMISYFIFSCISHLTV